MSKKIEAMERIIEFARANGFPGAHACFWDMDGQPLESPEMEAEYAGGEPSMVRLAMAFDGHDRDDDTGTVYVKAEWGEGGGCKTQIVDTPKELNE